MYQDALWLIESEPELAWLLLVSSLEIAANEWQKERGDAVKRLETSKPELYEFLLHHEDPEILRRVADSFADSLGITRKFVDFVLEFLPSPPNDRPGELWAQFEWTQDNLRRAMKAIYSYRSKALHDGRPFPLPMCSLPHHDRSWKAPAEIMTSLGTSDGTGTWLKKDVPMHLHLFEYIAREVLLKWWTVCATSSRS
jgi:hypothetical protein